LANGAGAPFENSIEAGWPLDRRLMEEVVMIGIIYLVGLIVVIMAILSFLGLR